MLNGRCQGFYCAAAVAELSGWGRGAPPPDRAGLRRRGDVLIVGAGPAGLAAAVELRRLGAGHVVVVERDDEAGGIPGTARTRFGARTCAGC